ncbi:MAG: glycoside hydrolase family 2 TIM barrel-domain containing protein [Candidatus Latescibacteria bacterium]|nr:glycoside hydrolase family 2 TIM barrel-domain containing protein [Candidatus Latescibacterota bacterium]
MAWKPIAKHIATPFAETVSPDNVLPEHPRPQMVREYWQNLNGLWDYTLEPVTFSATTGLIDAPTMTEGDQPSNWQGQILVPFTIDAPLSGIMEVLTSDQRIWYRRSITVSEDWASKRILLHLQASDWETSVYVNGKKIGQHRGGYDPFTFDITDQLQNDKNELTVCCWDATEEQAQAIGKQIMPENRQGFRYQPTGGIWQTVWLEAVPEQSIRTLHLTPDVDNSQLNINVSGENLDGCDIHIAATDSGQLIAETTSRSDQPIALSIPNAKLWNPDDPFLYDLKVTVQHNGEIVDTVDSYFGMRKLSVGEDDKGIKRFLLNDEPIFQLGPLDQGYWPDGILTPPSEEAIIFDLEYLKQISCNMVRPHIKTHPDRWYYHCDRLGLLIWQDMICMPKYGQDVTPEAAQQWKIELNNMMDWLHNHPSVVQWIVFNESWSQHDTKRYTDHVKQRDPSRLVTGASGWIDEGLADIYDIHDYTFYPATAMQQCANGRIALLGEAGGFNLCIPGHTWHDHEEPSEHIDHVNDITRPTYPTPEAMEDDYRFWVENLRAMVGITALNGVVYTQITDVEHELNGWLTYDRKISKIDPDKLGNIHATLWNPPQFETLIGSDTEWRYNTGEEITKPDIPEVAPRNSNLPDFGGDWSQPNFDASFWATGKGSFGATASATTSIQGDHLYLRTTVNLDQRPEKPVFYVASSADCQLFINGHLTRCLRVRQHSAPLSETCTLLYPDEYDLLKPGENVISTVLLPSQRSSYLAIQLLNMQ